MIVQKNQVSPFLCFPFQQLLKEILFPLLTNSSFPKISKPNIHVTS